MKKILVIKHGSLGDIIIAIPAMISIRKKHPECINSLNNRRKIYFIINVNQKIFDRIIIDNRKDFFIKSISKCYLIY